MLGMSKLTANCTIHLSTRVLRMPCYWANRRARLRFGSPASKIFGARTLTLQGRRWAIHIAATPLIARTSRVMQSSTKATWRLGFLNISEYLATYDIRHTICRNIRHMDPSVTERRQQSGKKPVLCMLGQLSTIMRGRERSDQESAYDAKIAWAIQHCSTPISSTSACGVARTSARRLCHLVRAGFFVDFLSPPPTPQRGILWGCSEGVLARFRRRKTPGSRPEKRFWKIKNWRKAGKKVEKKVIYSTQPCHVPDQPHDVKDVY